MSPALNMEELKAYIQYEINKGIEQALTNYVSIEAYNDLKGSYTDTVELLANAMKRISQLEKGLFLHDSDGDLVLGDDDKPIIAIVQANESTPEEPKPENPLIANTTLTKKASALTYYLKNKKPSWSGKIVMESEEIYIFFKEKIEENLRWPQDLKGYRGAKKDIIQRAKELYPNDVEIVKNKSGNKITGIALKPFSKRMDTYGC
jgi:hypothetical protein